MKQSKARSRILTILSNVLFGIVLLALGFLVVMNVWNMVDEKTGYRHPFLGFRSTVILTDSMSYVSEANEDRLPEGLERIEKDDIVLSTVDFTYESLKRDDVLLFLYEDRGLVCHRLYDKYLAEDGTEMVVTWGDANNQPDNPIPFSQVVGLVYDVIPDVGGVILFFQSPYGLLAVSLTIFFVSLGFFLAERETDLSKILTYRLLS